jgi:two-component system response regulator FlrC
MKEVVAEGKFREDLYYRLNVFPLHLLPLSDRPRDIIPLTEKLLEKHALASHRAIPTLSEEAQQKLFDYQWPGNVRELDNVVQRALILQSGDDIQANDIHFEAAAKAKPKPTVKVVSEKVVESVEAETPATENQAAEIPAESLTGDLKQREWNLILGAIKAAKGSRKMTAEKLGISERTLRYKLARMRDAGIPVPDSSGQVSSVG